MQNQAASIRILKAQMGQIHNHLANRSQRALPSSIGKNQKDQINIIKLRSGKQLLEQQLKEAEKENKESFVEEVTEAFKPIDPRKKENEKFT